MTRSEKKEAKAALARLVKLSAAARREASRLDGLSLHGVSQLVDVASQGLARACEKTREAIEAPDRGSAQARTVPLPFG